MRPRVRKYAGSSEGLRTDLALYYRETRSVDVSLVYIAFLGIFYELLLVRLDPGARGQYSARVHDLLWYLGPAARYCHYFLAALAGLAFYLAKRRGSPVFRLFPGLLAEAALLAILFGPVAMIIATRGATVIGKAPAPPEHLTPALLASLGAGIYEELLFRWIGLGGVFVALTKLAKLPSWLSVIVAMGFSAIAFALFHHIGPFGEPFDWRVLGFRVVAGIILGLVFVARGLGVVVYVHAFYDILYDLRGVLFFGG